MPDRRDFLKSAAAAATLSAMPGAVFAEAGRTMMTRKLPGTEEYLGVIGLGNSGPFYEGDLDVSRQLIGLLLERGGGYIDTAGPSRFTVGQIMKEQNAHAQLFLGTYLNGDNLQSMREEIREVQAGQGGGELDLVLTWSPKAMLERRDEYRQLRDDGLTRHVGIGRHQRRFYPDIAKLIDAGVVDLIQINYSMLEPEAADEILPLAMEKNIAVVINRAFVNGDYFQLVRGHELPAWAADFDCNSWAQFSLKYILAHPGVTCVLTETSNPKHAVDNFGAGFGRLPDEATRQRMAEVIRGIQNS